MSDFGRCGILTVKESSDGSVRITDDKGRSVRVKGVQDGIAVENMTPVSRVVYRVKAKDRRDENNMYVFSDAQPCMDWRRLEIEMHDK